MLRAFLADLSNGKKGLVGTYFVAPQDFVRWSDPISGIITYMAGPGNETETLDGLQAHFDALQRNGVSVTLTGFDDGGYTDDNPLADPPSGWFGFEVRGRASRGAAIRDGLGKGAIDCGSSKLRVFVIDGW